MLLYAIVFAVGATALLEAGARWNVRWEPQVAHRAGLFSYRDRLRSLFAKEPA